MLNQVQHDTFSVQEGCRSHVDEGGDLSDDGKMVKIVGWIVCADRAWSFTGIF